MAIVPPRKLPSPRKKSHRARRDLRRESAGGGRACQRICRPWDPSASKSRKLRRLLHERAVAKACLWLPAPRRCAPCGKRLDQRSNVSRPWLLAFSCFRRWFPGTANVATSAGPADQRLHCSIAAPLEQTRSSPFSIEIQLIGKNHRAGGGNALAHFRLSRE